MESSSDVESIEQSEGGPNWWIDSQKFILRMSF